MVVDAVAKILEDKAGGDIVSKEGRKPVLYSYNHTFISQPSSGLDAVFLDRVTMRTVSISNPSPT